MSTAPFPARFHAAHASPIAIRRRDDLHLVEWEVTIISFSGAPYLDTPWRSLAGRIAASLDASLVGDVTVTMGSRPYSLTREPLRLRFTTHTASLGGRSIASPALTERVMFEIL